MAKFSVAEFEEAIDCSKKALEIDTDYFDT
jgi:hypothetical protein